MITLFSLFPSHLNLNGDAGNVTVLEQRLKWVGADVQVVEINSSAELDSARGHIAKHPSKSFVSAGHGSLAAMRDLEKHSSALVKLFDEVKATNVCGIAVGSAAKWTSHSGSANSSRLSEFATVELTIEGWPSQALGYINSESALPPLAISNKLIVTLLNGPFLAKNPEFANAILESLGVFGSEANQRSEIVDGYVAEIWKLESPTKK